MSAAALVAALAGASGAIDVARAQPGGQSRAEETARTRVGAQPTTGEAGEPDAQPTTGEAGAQPAPGDPAASPAASAASAAAARDDDGDRPADYGVPGDQAITVQLGFAGGGGVTPGGLRIAGHYLYQLSDRDWFDGTAGFTFGSGRGACFRDREDDVICDHGATDGAGVEVTASVRRLFGPRGAFRPFARIGIGVGLARFGDDELTGFTVPLHGGGGVRVAVARSIALVVDGDIALGFASFGRGLGARPQLGLAITAGAEFRLR